MHISEATSSQKQLKVYVSRRSCSEWANKCPGQHYVHGVKYLVMFPLVYLLCEII